jgi:DNA replication protein DnaC
MQEGLVHGFIEHILIPATAEMLGTSNLPFDEWTSVFGSERLTGALLDRLTHHVHILEMGGDSFRLAYSKQRSPRARLESSPDAVLQK